MIIAFPARPISRAIELPGFVHPTYIALQAVAAMMPLRERKRLARALKLRRG